MGQEACQQAAGCAWDHGNCASTSLKATCNAVALTGAAQDCDTYRDPLTNNAVCMSSQECKDVCKTCTECVQGVTEEFLPVYTAKIGTNKQDELAKDISLAGKPAAICHAIAACDNPQDDSVKFCHDKLKLDYCSATGMAAGPSAASPSPAVSGGIGSACSADGECAGFSVCDTSAGCNAVSTCNPLNGQSSKVCKGTCKAWDVFVKATSDMFGSQATLSLADPMTLLITLDATATVAANSTLTIKPKPLLVDAITGSIPVQSGVVTGGLKAAANPTSPTAKIGGPTKIGGSCGNQASTFAITFDGSASPPNAGRPLTKYAWSTANGSPQALKDAIAAASNLPRVTLPAAQVSTLPAFTCDRYNVARTAKLPCFPTGITPTTDVASGTFVFPAAGVLADAGFIFEIGMTATKGARSDTDKAVIRVLPVKDAGGNPIPVPPTGSIKRVCIGVCPKKHSPTDKLRLAFTANSDDSTSYTYAWTCSSVDLTVSGAASGADSANLVVKPKDAAGNALLADGQTVTCQAQLGLLTLDANFEAVLELGAAGLNIDEAPYMYGTTTDPTRGLAGPASAAKLASGASVQLDSAAPAGSAPSGRHLLTTITINAGTAAAAQATYPTPSYTIPTAFAAACAGSAACTPAKLAVLVKYYSDPATLQAAYPSLTSGGNTPTQLISGALNLTISSTGPNAMQLPSTSFAAASANNMVTVNLPLTSAYMPGLTYACVVMTSSPIAYSGYDAAGYNVRVDIAPTAGSVIVPTTVLFLDGNTAGAAAFYQLITTSSYQTSLFPIAYFGTVSVSGATLGTSVNPNAAPAKKKANTGAIVGGVIGGVAFLCLVAGVAFYIHRKRRGYSNVNGALATPMQGNTEGYQAPVANQ
ncbi:hypothetical protein WJX72_001647 [[Myrmecia] bisecta]|uniref:Uncharacterized protein n=1 Tax=[Myrmecia] bisecta TaxID=41462 RepID=A0AAW1QP70_9CHLO